MFHTRSADLRSLPTMFSSVPSKWPHRNISAEFRLTTQAAPVRSRTNSNVVRSSSCLLAALEQIPHSSRGQSPEGGGSSEPHGFSVVWSYSAAHRTNALCLAHLFQSMKGKIRETIRLT